MKDMILVLVHLVFLFIPLALTCPMIVAYRKLKEELNEKRTMRETQINIRRVRDLFPKNIKGTFEKNKRNCKNDIRRFMKKYNSFFVCTVLHYVLWIVYIVVVIIWMFNVCASLYIEKELNNGVFTFVSIGGCIVEIYWFLLGPIFKMCGKEKLVQVGYDIYEYIDKLVEQSKVAVLRILGAMVSFGILSFLMYLFEDLCDNWIGEWGVLAYILFLMIYQYVILKLLSRIIYEIVIRIKKDSILIMGITQEIIYVSLKNCTYLSMVFASSLLLEPESVIVVAIGFLFLFDDYLSKERDKKALIDENKRRELITRQDL